jgi:hypothetical protein
MPRPTIEELQRFWLLAYSRSSLLDANRFLEAMETENPNSIALRAMIDAGLVAYARPFSKFRLTRERRVAPLAGIPPPTHLAEYHQDALDLRNKLIGHRCDPGAETYDDTECRVGAHGFRSVQRSYDDHQRNGGPDEKRNQRALRVIRGTLRGKLKAFNEGLFL